MRKWGLLCLLVLHSPDGSKLLLDRDHISAVRPARSEQIAKGSNSVVYTSDENFAVSETEDEIVQAMDECKKEK